MAVPEDRPEIAALKNDITIPTALITQVAESALANLEFFCCISILDA